MGNNAEMRKVFCDTLIDLAKTDDRICIINSDSRQISGTLAFEQAYPERSFNVGIAEANMVWQQVWPSVEKSRLFTLLVPL